MYVLLAALMWFSCNNEPEPKVEVADPHSYAMPSEAKVTHLDLDLNVDFNAEKLIGTAILKIDRSKDSKQIRLDTKQLIIESVLISPDGVKEKVAKYRFGQDDKILGKELIVELEPQTQYIHISYQTEPGAEALQFLPPALTDNKTSPFLLTQSQAINARTWVPIQDSPGIRFTYNATIKVPEGLMAVMSAKNPTHKSNSGVYSFEMPQPIPAYLLALAVGDIEFRSLGEKTGVYAEPSMIEKAVYEFGDLNKMMNIAEKLYGEYQWGRYDVIVLPPSFPFGGMENPRLTFATPTIIAEDRSLVSLIAHELAHSWSGNLVTNATWNDFWLNEGFTVYFENRIMEELEGPEYASMLAQISYEDLEDEIEEIGFDHLDTKLAIELTDRNPDDGMTSIAYDKGFYFLKLIEETVGRKSFDQFLKKYFTEHAFKTMTTDDFVAYLRTELLENHDDAEEMIQVNAWVYDTGIPDNIPFNPSTRFQAVEDQVHGWIAGLKPKDMKEETKNWSSHEWLHFIRVLPDSISSAQMDSLDKVFDFTNSTNSEVQCVWYTKAVKSGYEPAYENMKQFLYKVGRRKFLMPLYEAMTETEEGTEMAKEIYRVARQNYHPIAILSIDKLLKWEPES
ncbi:MAG: M1 family metallopeptidase [Bacteroidetes bacterium]|nr:M1 family metallopeptidase [Bacteroidota bacterium]MCB0842852.1 M1 family metallopeptidase [Bacteroidota bacterium]